MRQDLPTQTLRGLACVLLVLYHVVGSSPSFGLQVADGPLRTFNDALATLRMPLFTVLSGWVYGLRPLGTDAGAFMLGKARRLLLPMVVVGTSLAALQGLVPGTHALPIDWHTLHLLPVGHLWYLESLLWVFAVVALLERTGGLRDSRAFALTALCAMAVHLLAPGTAWLGVEGALYLLPYFLAGLALQRFDLRAWVRRHAMAWAVLAGVAVLVIGPPLPDPERRTVGMLLAGVSLCALLLAWSPRSTLLARLGTGSYTVFLYHVFFTAAARMVLLEWGVGSLAVHIVAGLTAGLLGPLCLRRLAESQPWSLPWLMGERATRRQGVGALRGVAA